MNSLLTLPCSLIRPMSSMSFWNWTRSWVSAWRNKYYSWIWSILNWNSFFRTSTFCSYLFENSLIWLVCHSWYTLNASSYFCWTTGATCFSQFGPFRPSSSSDSSAYFWFPCPDSVKSALSAPSLSPLFTWLYYVSLLTPSSYPFDWVPEADMKLTLCVFIILRSSWTIALYCWIKLFSCYFILIFTLSKSKSGMSLDVRLGCCSR